MDNRVAKHAKILVEYSTKVKEGDNVLILMQDYGLELASEIYKQAAIIGASPLIVITPTEMMKEYYELTPERFLSMLPKNLYTLFKESDVVVSIKGEENLKAMTNVNPMKIGLRSKAIQPIKEEYLKKRWVVTQYPCVSYAQEAEMSLREYEDFVYGAILLDWEEEKSKMERIKRIIENSDKISIFGEDTEIEMSVKGRKAIVDAGEHNMPGGEIFTAPVENSVNGKIYFDLPAIAFGKEISGIRVEFENGKINKISAEKNEDLLRTLINIDEGAKVVGEFGIGMNEKIKKFTKNILFDEKIGGTIHLAIGSAYKECGGKNESAIHLDMIKTMKGGTIFADGKTIQKDGKFI
ncbi:MAG: aminopeptidase [Candidatus Aenigmatarchaeota archaeon]